MENTNTEVVAWVNPISGKDFGELVSLPDLYAKNLERVVNAQRYTELQMSAVNVVDMKTVGAEFMETLLVPVVELRSLLAQAKKEIEEERKPHTQKMDAIKSLFTGLEKDFDALLAIPTAVQNKWELEKIDRKKIADKKIADDLAKSNERAEAVGYFKKQIISEAGRVLLADITAMRTAFYSKSIEELEAFGIALSAYSPILDEETYSTIRDTATYLSPRFIPEEITVMRDEAAAELNLTVPPDYARQMTAERDRLIELIPARKLEIAEGNKAAEDARIAKEQAELAQEITETTTAQVQAEESNTEMKKLDSAFTVVASAGPVLEKSKGSTQKKKYQIDSLQAFTAIIQQWVMSEMPKLTVEEVSKKLSFMVTAANVQLNKGVTLEAKGLSVVDDVSTKSQSIKKVA